MLQSSAVNVSVSGDAVTSESPGADTPIVTVPAGADSSATVYVALSPSPTARAVSDTYTPRVSSSVIVTVSAVTSSPATAPSTAAVSSSSSK